MEAETVGDIRIQDIRFNTHLYPRSKVDQAHVKAIAEALRAGCELPPVVVDKKTGMIVDGEHRRQAHILVGREMIRGKYEDYADNHALMKAAIELNSTHGMPLTEADKTKCLRMRASYRMEEGELLSLLKITRSYAQTLHLERTNGNNTGSGKPVRRQRRINNGRRGADAIPAPKPQATNIACPSCGKAIQKQGLEYKCTACGFGLSSWPSGAGRAFLFILDPKKITPQMMEKISTLMRGISKGGERDA